MNTIEEGLAAVRAGKMIVIVDDEDRENEGDLFVAAQAATPEIINFMAHFGCGLICVPMEKARLSELSMEQMVTTNTDNHGTAFTVSVDHAGTTTGISAFERSHTIARLVDPTAGAADFRRPGHVFPLEAKVGGVLVRAGHTEAAVDLARLADPGCIPAGVICEIMNGDGTMARLTDLVAFAERHGLCIITIEDLIRYRRSKEKLIVRETETLLPTKYGNFRLFGYTEIHAGKEHLALVMGDISDGQSVMCRIHSECLTGDALGSARCDCGEQYGEAMRRIAAEGRGILVYLRQEGRGIGLINKLKAYALQDRGLDTVDANLHLGFAADLRDYRIGVQILQDLGVRKLRVLTNNPAKIEGLEKYGIEVEERLPLLIKPNRYNEFYLNTKEDRMSHRLESDEKKEGKRYENI
jgi:3,4-dihydroxy 2-butanone 4-phosphate synthase/GTP cyclohydrolase II